MRDALSGFIDLAASSPDPLHAQIARQIKQAVLSGRLPERTRVSSSRALAAELGVSRNTVLAALEQLKAEGYLESAPRSAMRVASLSASELMRGRASGAPAVFIHSLAHVWQEVIAKHYPATPERYEPFRPGIPDLHAFPHELWGALLRRASRRVDALSAGYGNMSGHPRLREVLSAHLAEARGVSADPGQIIVTSSARGGLSLIASALVNPGEEVWIEEPGFRSAKAAFASAGAVLRPAPVDEHGLDAGAMPPDAVPRVIYTTPSHQFPTGVLMTLGRRLELLDRAARAGAYVVEDDYDSEFQYRGRPIAALQGLDRAGCVLYLGTFAKSLLPSLRVGFVVAPPGLAEGLARVQRFTGQLVPPVIQLALADFLEGGHYRAHVRRMRSLYAERLEAFAKAVAKSSGGRLKAACPDGGMQTVVTWAGEGDEGGLAEKLRAAGIECQPLGELHLEPQMAVHRGVLMGFSAWGEAETRRAFGRLAAVFAQKPA